MSNLSPSSRPNLRRTRTKSLPSPVRRRWPKTTSNRRRDFCSSDRLRTVTRPLSLPIDLCGTRTLKACTLLSTRTLSQTQNSHPRLPRFSYTPTSRRFLSKPSITPRFPERLCVRLSLSTLACNLGGANLSRNPTAIRRLLRCLFGCCFCCQRERIMRSRNVVRLVKQEGRSRGKCMRFLWNGDLRSLRRESIRCVKYKRGNIEHE